MSDRQPTQVTCRWCGEVIPGGAARCPACRRPVPSEDAAALSASAARSGWPSVPLPPPPLARPREELPPVPIHGQESFASWSGLKQILRADKVLGAVLMLMALSIVLHTLTGAPLVAFFSFVVIAGILSFRFWGYLLAMFAAGLGLLARAGTFLSHQPEGLLAAWLIASVLINGFALWALCTRRESFD